MKILNVYSLKGGVGKTSAAVNLAYEAARSGLKTLIWDVDPQGASTYYFRIKPKLKSKNNFLKKKSFIDMNIKGSDYDMLDILPADFSIRHIDLIIREAEKSPKKINYYIRASLSNYDLVVLDSPPGMNLMSELLLGFSDIILTPIVPTTLSLRTHELLLNYFRKKSLDSEKLFSFFSMVDRRKNMHLDTMKDFRKSQNRILRTLIMNSAVIEKMGLKREPVACYEPNHVSTMAFRSLWREVKSVIKK